MISTGRSDNSGTPCIPGYGGAKGEYDTRSVLSRSVRCRWSRQGGALDLGPSETRGDVRRRDGTRRDASGRVGSGRLVVSTAIGSEWVYRYHCRDRSAARYARIPLRANARPIHTFPFHFLSARDPLRASERKIFLALALRALRLVLPPPSLSLSLSLILFSSVAPSIAAELCGLTRSYDFSGRVLGHLLSYLEKRPLDDSAAISCPCARAPREKGEESPSARERDTSR